MVTRRKSLGPAIDHRLHVHGGPLGGANGGSPGAPLLCSNLRYSAGPPRATSKRPLHGAHGAFEEVSFRWHGDYRPPTYTHIRADSHARAAVCRHTGVVNIFVFLHKPRQARRGLTEFQRVASDELQPTCHLLLKADEPVYG